MVYQVACLVLFVAGTLLVRTGDASLFALTIEAEHSACIGLGTVQGFESLVELLHFLVLGCRILLEFRTTTG